MDEPAATTNVLWTSNLRAASISSPGKALPSSTSSSSSAAARLSAIPKTFRNSSNTIMLGNAPSRSASDASDDSNQSLTSKIKGTIFRVFDEDNYLNLAEEARRTRRKLFIRGIYSEFMCTSILMVGVYGSIANCYQRGSDSESTAFIASLTSGLGVVLCTYAFSDLSGAQMNPAISFALWFTNRLSNRKFVCFVVAQYMASLVAAAIVYLTFIEDGAVVFDYINVKPPNGINLYKLFLTELLATFILSYVAFTVAFEDTKRLARIAQLRKTVTENPDSLTQNNELAFYATNPQSKSGFAPFAIGFTIFVMSLYGGSSGCAMNPVRMFGPMIFCNDWSNYWLYLIAEFVGAPLAACMVHYFHMLGVEQFSEHK